MMSKIGAFLIVCACLVMGSVICLAAEYPISKQTYDELLLVGNNISVAADTFAKHTTANQGTITLEELHLFNMMDGEALRVTNELLGIKKMLEMEFKHAEASQLNSKATDIIIDYIVNIVVSDVKELQSRYIEYGSAVTEEVRRNRAQSYGNNFTKVLEVLNKIIEELPKASN